MYEDWGYPDYRADVMTSYRPTHGRHDAQIAEAVSQLRHDPFFEGWGGTDLVSSVLAAGQRLGSTDYFVWGPRLVRAVLSPDVVSHRLRSLEQRRAFAECLRQLIHYGHHVRDIDPAWQRLTDEAFEEARVAFIDGAPTQAELDREVRRDYLVTLVGGQSVADLDVAPLVLGELDLADVEPEIRSRMQRLDDLVGEALALPSTPLAAEAHVVGRRLLVRAAVRYAPMFRRPSRDDNLAAGVAIVAAEGNGLGRLFALTRHDIAGRLGVIAGNVERGRTVAKHAGAQLVKPPAGRRGEADRWRGYSSVFTDPELQTSATRRLLRESWEALVYPESADARCVERAAS